MRRPQAALALAALVLVAGCPLGDSGSAPTPQPSTFDYPDGFSADGITNETAALRTHAESLDAPYTVTFLLSQSGKRGKAVVNGTIKVQPGAERSLTLLTRRAGGDMVRMQTFQNGTDRFVYRATESDFSSWQHDQSFRRPLYADRGTLAEMLGSLDLNATAVRAHNGTAVVVYTVTNVTADRLTTRTADCRGNVSIDTTGRIRSVDLRFTQFVSGVEREVVFEYATTVDANVTVERPDWAE